MATVPHVTAWAGRTEYQADGFLFDWVYHWGAFTQPILPRKSNVRPARSEWVSVALDIQHAKLTDHIIFAHVACLVVPYFSTLRHKRHDFRGGKKRLNIKRVLWLILQLVPETSLVLRRTDWDTVINVHTSSCKVSIILAGFQQNLNFLGGFSKNTQISNLIKICPVGAEFFHTNAQVDRQTDFTKLILAFRNVANAPKNPPKKLFTSDKAYIRIHLHFPLAKQ